jgi:glutamate synthase (NADPH/NADH) small chain
LPKYIVKTEVNYVTSLGVNIELNSVIGKTLTVDELFGQGFHAVFLGSGAGLPIFLNVPGENLARIYSANEFMTRINLMKAYRFPEYDTPIQSGKRVVVVGGGNVAMDAARSVLRLGADEVHIMYRRSEKEMPARQEEVENAFEEGIIFHFLTSPTRFIANGIGQVEAAECIRMDLGEPDETNRRRPIPREGSGFTFKTDLVIIALGTHPNPLIPATTSGLEISQKGTVVTETNNNGRTTKQGVWAGGDVVTGSATVISAMGAAKRAASDIDIYLRDI